MTDERLAVLHVSLGDITGRKTFNINEQLRIGREANENDVIVPSLNVSRRHARVFRDADRYILEDLGSHNGTLLNGRLARKEVLKDGDVINIAEAELKFQLQDDRAATADIRLSNTDVGEIASNQTAFMDLSELNPEAMKKLREQKPENAGTWEEDKPGHSQD